MPSLKLSTPTDCRTRSSRSATGREGNFVDAAVAAAEMSPKRWTDRVTGLMWMRDALPGKHSWDEAME